MGSNSNIFRKSGRLVGNWKLDGGMARKKSGRLVVDEFLDVHEYSLSFLSSEGHHFQI